MTSRNRNPHFDDGESARPDFRNSGRTIQTRKIEQLCAQIRRAIELALLGEVQDELFDDLEVEDVKPGADPGRVHVQLVYHGDTTRHDRGEVSQRIEAARNILTAEVAQAIHRRKVPDLVFEVRSH